jgi:hypothetical protein
VTFAAVLGEEAQVVRLRCEKCGQSYPGNAGHRCAAEEAEVADTSNNTPFDDGTWRREYMRNYMRRWRERSRAVVEEKQASPEDEKEPFVQKKPRPKDRGTRWVERAEELKVIAEGMVADELRAMMERMAQDYAHGRTRRHMDDEREGSQRMTALVALIVLVLLTLMPDFAPVVAFRGARGRGDGDGSDAGVSEGPNGRVAKTCETFFPGVS